MLVLKVKGKEKQILEPAVNQYKELPDKIKNTPPEFQNQRTRTSSSKRSRPPATVNRFLNEERFLDHTVLSFRNLIKGLDVFLRRMRIHHQENFLMNSLSREIASNMKRSSLWYLPGEISSQMLGLTDELPVRT